MIQVSIADQTHVHQIKIGRRILEILEEKGISPNSFSQRIGMAKSTFYNCINDERTIKPSELQNIARHLKMNVARIKQEDIKKELSELDEMFRTACNLSRALELSQYLASVAIGATEHSRAMNDLGNVYFLLQQYEKAHTVWTEAFRYAENLNTKFGDRHYFYIVLSNLMKSYTVRKEFSNALAILEKAEPVFKDDPKKQGHIHYTRAIVEEHSGNIIAAKQHAYSALDCYRQCGSERQIVKAEINVAHFEFKSKNYVETQKRLEHVMKSHLPDPFIKLFATKEYVKTLLKLKQFGQAKRILEETHTKMGGELKNYPILRDKMKLLLSIAQHIPMHAEQLLFSDNVDQKVRKLAYTFLRKYCLGTDDGASLVKYSKIADSLLNSADVLDEEEF